LSACHLAVQKLIPHRGGVAVPRSQGATHTSEQDSLLHERAPSDILPPGYGSALVHRVAPRASPGSQFLTVKPVQHSTDAPCGQAYAGVRRSVIEMDGVAIGKNRVAERNWGQRQIRRRRAWRFCLLIPDYFVIYWGRRARVCVRTIELAWQ